MKLGSVLGICWITSLALLAACSSTDSDTSGLLDGGGSGGGSTAKYNVGVDGPDCVEPGQFTSGYEVSVSTLSGAVAKNVYVSILALTDPDDETTSVGTVRATMPDGSTRLNGANTNDEGTVSFTFTPPSDAIRNSVLVTIVATVKVNDVDSGSGTLPLELQPLSKPSVSVQGPDDGSGTRPSSGSLVVASGELAPDFVVSVAKSQNGCGTSGPIKGATITVTPKLTDASIRIVEGTTLLDGTASFDYIAPTVTTRTADQVSVVANYNGVNSDPAVYSLFVDPPPPEPDTTVTITGPSSASAGQEQTGYSISVQSASTAKVAQENVKVLVTLSDSGTVTFEPNSQGLRGVTDAFGKVAFSITPKSTTASNTTVTVTVKLDTTNKPDLATSCAQTGSTCTATFDVLVQPDIFKFTAPVFGSAGTVGELNAVPLAFLWTTASGTGVPGCVNLSAAFQGSGTSPYLLKINGDNVPAAQTRVVQLASDGTFQVPVAVLSDRSGFVQVTANENRKCVTSTTTTSGPLTATTGVQFIDEVCETTSDGRNCVDLTAPLRVLTSPDDSGNQRTAALTLSVLNSAYSPVDGAQVLFTIIDPAATNDPNERVFPGGGTTNANGIASSLYYIPVLALDPDEVATVDVRGCVRRTTSTGDEASQVCSTRRIEIVAPAE
jgi:hypothetical protein